MLSSSVLLIALLATPVQTGRAAELAPMMDVPQCTVPFVEPDAALALDVVTSPEGGAWWLRREGEHAQLLAVPEALEVRTGGGELADVELEVREGALRIPVPEGAMNGDSFLLASSINSDTVVLRVAAVDLVDELTLETFAVGVKGVDQTTCFVDCTREGQTVPRVPTIELLYSGGPAAVTVRYQTDGFMLNGNPDAAPVIRDLILAHASSTRSVTLEAAQYIEGTATGAASIEIVPLFGGESIIEEAMVADVEEVPFEGDTTFMQSCDDYYGDRGYYDTECACARPGAGRPAAGMLAALALVGLARRRRRVAR